MSATKNNFRTSYVFNNVHQLVKFLYLKFSNKYENTNNSTILPPVKLQKGLYFLYIYYLEFYNNDIISNIETKNERSNDIIYPKELFPAKFTAWDYGPVIVEVHENLKINPLYYVELNDLDDIELNKLQKQSFFPEIEKFIMDLFSQVIESSDFTLVSKTHESEAWKIAYQTEHKIMDNDVIYHEIKNNFLSK